MKLGGEVLEGLFESATWRAYRGEELMPFSEIKKLIGPNSIDVTLGNTFLLPVMSKAGIINLGCQEVDPRDPKTLEWDSVTADEIVLYPGGFMLGAVRERFICEALISIDGGEAARDIMTMRIGGGPQPGSRVTRAAVFAPMYEGRSSCGRLGLASHITAGFGDYGFSGAFTLELYNHLQRPIKLYAGMRIGQVAFEEVCGPKRYAGAYSGTNHNAGPVPPKLGPDRF